MHFVRSDDDDDDGDGSCDGGGGSKYSYMPDAASDASCWLVGDVACEFTPGRAREGLCEEMADLEPLPRLLPHHAYQDLRP